MKRRRLRRGPSLGGVSPSWRWEVAAPLAFIGVVVLGVGAEADKPVLVAIGLVLIALATAAFSAG